MKKTEVASKKQLPQKSDEKALAKLEESAPSAFEDFPEVKLSPLGLTVEGKITQKRFMKVWEKIAGIHKASRWWLGDMLVEAELRFKDDNFYQVATDNELSVEYLRDLASLARRVKNSARTISLSQRHHRAVAKLPEPDQRRLLGEAEKGRWTSDRLRLEVDKRYPESKAEKPSKLSLEQELRAAGQLYRYKLVVDFLKPSAVFRDEMQAIIKKCGGVVTSVRGGWQEKEPGQDVSVESPAAEVDVVNESNRVDSNVAPEPDREPKPEALSEKQKQDREMLERERDEHPLLAGQQNAE